MSCRHNRIPKCIPVFSSTPLSSFSYHGCDSSLLVPRKSWPHDSDLFLVMFCLLMSVVGSLLVSLVRNLNFIFITVDSSQTAPFLVLNGWYSLSPIVPMQCMVGHPEFQPTQNMATHTFQFSSPAVSSFLLRAAQLKLIKFHYMILHLFWHPTIPHGRQSLWLSFQIQIKTNMLPDKSQVMQAMNQRTIALYGKILCWFLLNNWPATRRFINTVVDSRLSQPFVQAYVHTGTR